MRQELRLGNVGIRFARPLQRGTLVRRISRFMAEVKLDGEAVLAFVANSGRLTGLMLPGTPVLVAAVGGKSQDSRWTRECPAKQSSERLSAVTISQSSASASAI